MHLQMVSVKRFSLTLVAVAKIWIESIRSTTVDWKGFKAQFRQQYSRIGNIKEQLFHAWGSFHFDENAEKKQLCHM